MIYFKKKGFTLIELIVVMAVIGILVLLASPKFMGYQEKARLTEIKNNIKQLENASERYYIDKQEWPRATNEYYTADQLEEFAKEIQNKTGVVVTLEEDGKYYPISYDKLQKYVQEPKDGIHYVLQNPVGEIFYLKDLTDLGETTLNVDKITDNNEPTPPVQPANNKPVAVIGMTPEDNLFTSTNIAWSSDNSSDPDSDKIIKVEWKGKQDIYTTEGEYTVELRVQDEHGLWSDWTKKIFTVEKSKTLMFNGIDSYILLSKERAYLSHVKDSFTYEFWVKPESSHVLLDENYEGPYTFDYYSMVINASQIQLDDGGGAGVSVGTNGIVVVEHSGGYYPRALVYDEPIEGWTHVAVVYKDKKPSLYINGKFVKEGTTSERDVYPSASYIGRAFSHSSYSGYFKGSIKDIRIWNYSRTEYEIQNDMNKSLTGNEAGLEVFLPLNESIGTSIHNESPSKSAHDGTIYGATWTNE